MNAIETRNLSVSLGKRPVLHGITLGIERGEIAGLIGPNGSGKTTFIRTLAGLVTPRNGTLSLAGIPKGDHARRIGYLPQERLLHWPLRVRTVVMLGRIPHLRAWQAASQEDEKAVDAALEETGIRHLAERDFNQLAGGEKAMVFLARVLAAKPEILLADEPVAGLDPYHEMEAMELLGRYARETKAAVLVVLHNLTLAARFCRSLFLLHEGRLISGGRPEEVLSPENLETAYHIRARYSGPGEASYVLPWERIHGK